MHPELQRFCLKVKERFPEFFVRQNVLDVGSQDINGCNRYLFTDCVYTGLDVGAGKNVDVVSPVHLYNGGPFDTIISTSAFEHDMHIASSLLQIPTKLLKPGGLFLFTCSNERGSEHGTRRCTPQDSPLTTQIPEWADYFRGLSVADAEAMLPLNLFAAHEFESVGADLYFWGIKHV